MCGICGFSGRSNQDLLQRMGNSIIHRGPDESGYYSEHNMNLCIRRLSIVDLNSGHQPIHNEDGTKWIVCNGEIYNHRELRKKLISLGHIFYTDHSDVEVILHLYEEYGDDFLQYLNGMFAIAIWDSQTGRLLLARDRMGVKPLFYAVVGEEFVFASEIKSILQYPTYRKGLDYGAVYHYFSFKNIVPPRTAFQGIYEILPGQYGIWHNGKITLRQYWKIDYSVKSEDSISQAVEKIRTFLWDAAKLRLEADVSVGAFLSGGLDSSLATAMLAKQSSRRLKTFALCYEPRETSIYKKDLDRVCAQKVSKMYDTEHHEYLLRPQEVLESMSEVVRAFDQPFSGVTSTFFLSRFICKYVKVAVAGDGADELFGSYLSHRLAYPFHQYAEERKKSGINDMAGEYRQGEFPADFLARLFQVTDGEMGDLSYRLLQFHDDEKMVLLSKNFIDNCCANQISDDLEGFCTTRELVMAIHDSCTAVDPLDRMLEYDWKIILANQVLAFVDFLSMANSLEVRSPYLDYRLVEYVAALPGNYKIHDNITKYILKEAARGYLPDDVIDRPKEGFVLPIYDWMQSEFKEYVYDTLSEVAVKRMDVLDYTYVSNLLDAYYETPGARPQTAALIWNLVMFTKWYQEYFEKSR